MNDDGNARPHDLGARSHRLFVGADLRSAPADQRDTRLPDGKDHYRRRSSLRLPHHDYASPAAYFITVCTHQRRCLLGNIGDDAMQLNEAGRVVDACWRDLPRHYAHVALDTFVIMPNHIHGIVTILPTTTSARAHGLTQIVRSFKAFSARQMASGRCGNAAITTMSSAATNRWRRSGIHRDQSDPLVAGSREPGEHRIGCAKGASETRPYGRMNTAPSVVGADLRSARAGHGF
ncbi:MAG: transposase [Rhodospirillales bacterium]